MKVSVDRSACYGSAECAHRAPSVFAFEDGYGVVRPGRERAADDPQVREGDPQVWEGDPQVWEGDPQMWDDDPQVCEAVREAAERCPSQAIVVSE
ncbi:ferredoxin [Streptomyces sp. NPDC020800]|uniref:ferredoxin n=1 Tax=Streptomyces sp. NPDC020800 TaxID=3365092 RepID=UPI0037AD568D